MDALVALRDHGAHAQVQPEPGDQVGQAVQVGGLLLQPGDPFVLGPGRLQGVLAGRGQPGRPLKGLGGGAAGPVGGGGGQGGRLLPFLGVGQDGVGRPQGGRLGVEGGRPDVGLVGPGQGLLGQAALGVGLGDPALALAGPNSTLSIAILDCCPCTRASAIESIGRASIILNTPMSYRWCWF